MWDDYFDTRKAFAKQIAKVRLREKCVLLKNLNFMPRFL